MHRLFLAMMIAFPPLAQGSCPAWGEGKKIMDIDSDLVPEASGLIVSKATPDTFFHVNDSGDGAYLYMSNAKSGVTKKIKVNNFEPFDIEDFGYGPCENSNCIVIADIGDNKLVRKTINLVVLDEPKPEASAVDIKRSINVKYPDGPHNAEGLSIHPNGDIFIVTKEKSKKKDPLTARLYKLEKSAWQTESKGVKTLAFVGEIVVSAENLGQKDSNRITSMDIHPTGGSILLLTYGNVLEFNVDLAKVDTKTNFADTLKIISVPNMPKQESIAFANDGKGFYYTSEANKKKVRKALKKGQTMHHAALMHVGCL